MGTIIEALSAWTSSVTFDAIPDEAKRVGRNCLIDTLGVAIVGSRTKVAGRAREVAFAVYGAGSVSVVGASSKLNASGAALANGTAAHALDFDDNCYAGFVHGSAVIVPAVLAAAEAEDSSGAELLTALVAASEAEYAVGDAVSPHLYEKGWWTTGVLGPVGSAAAAARIMRLDAVATGAALGLATAGTGGAKACFGTDGKPVLCGRTAEAGVTAAALARSGVSGPANAFEDSRGFARLFNDGILEADAVDGLGRAWRMLKPGVDVKRVPVCLSAHAALDGVMDLMAEHGIAASDIRRVVCDVGPIVTANLVYMDPATPQQGQFSLPFVIGCMLARGDVGLADIAEETLRDPAVRAGMAKVEMVTGAMWGEGSERARLYPEGAHVALETVDGRRLERFNGFARGTTARPLSDDELSAKFMACTMPVLGAASAESLLDRLRRVETLPSARDLLT